MNLYDDIHIFLDDKLIFLNLPTVLKPTTLISQNISMHSVIGHFLILVKATKVSLYNGGIMTVLMEPANSLITWVGKVTEIGF